MKKKFSSFFKKLFTLLPMSSALALALYVKSGVGSIDWETLLRGTPGGK